MKCWRDLSHDCAKNDCPMWMEGFDLPTLGDGSGIGLNESKCAMVLKEKIALYQGLLDIMEFIEDTEGLFDEDLSQMIDDAPRVSSRRGSKTKEPLQNTLLPHHNEKTTATKGPSPQQKRGKKK